MKVKCLEKQLSKYNFVHDKAMWTGKGSNLGLCSERSETNHLSHCSAISNDASLREKLMTYSKHASDA